jgi:sterol desaturase/sphingolipid hydroxylase (fatty acid hydroxylase superfamily)
LYILEKLLKQVFSFFRIYQLSDVYKHGGFDAFFTFQGVTTLLLFLMPIILFIEIFRSFFVLKKGIRGFIMPLIIDVANRLISRVIGISVGAFCIVVFKPYALFETTLTWYWFAYAYVIWELGHFIYHYLCHKVRLFWCLHSTHHTPEEMNMSVSYSHFFLEAPFSDFIRTTTCILLGVSPLMFAMVVVIDWVWAELNHLSEDTLKDASFGMVGKFILTPSHHRVHHSRNELYLDKNFGNLLNIWDKVFQTYQPELPEVKPEYGITRKVNTASFWDVYFGEIYHLAKDVYFAPGIKNKLKYLFFPPGWTHTGDSQMVRQNRKKQSPKVN